MSGASKRFPTCTRPFGSARVPVLIEIESAWAIWPCLVMAMERIISLMSPPALLTRAIIESNIRVEIYLQTTLHSQSGMLGMLIAAAHASKNKIPSKHTCLPNIPQRG
jgi:hypothetical protein